MSLRVGGVGLAVALLIALPCEARGADRMVLAGYDLASGEPLWTLASHEVAGARLGCGERRVVIERFNVGLRSVATVDRVTGEVVEQIDERRDVDAPIPPRYEAPRWPPPVLGNGWPLVAEVPEDGQAAVPCFDDGSAEPWCIEPGEPVDDLAIFDTLVAVGYPCSDDDACIGVWRAGHRGPLWRTRLSELAGLETPLGDRVSLASEGTLLVASSGALVVGLDFEAGTRQWLLDGSSELGVEAHELSVERSVAPALALEGHLMAVAWERRVAVFALGGTQPRLVWSLEPGLERHVATRMTVCDGVLVATVGVHAPENEAPRVAVAP